MTGNTQFLGRIGYVTRRQIIELEFLTCKHLQFHKIAFGVGLGTICKLVQKVQHLLRGFRHLGFQRIVRIGRKIEHARHRLAQLDDLLHQRRVVPRGLAELRRAR